MGGDVLAENIDQSKEGASGGLVRVLDLGSIGQIMRKARPHSLSAAASLAGRINEKKGAALV
jgi:hypothetical protein